MHTYKQNTEYNSTPRLYYHCLKKVDKHLHITQKISFLYYFIILLVCIGYFCMNSQNIK